MSSNVKVSSSFNKFMAKNSDGIQEARQADNTMMTCKMPVGWTGPCICIGAEADKGKDRKNEDGSTVEGREYVRLEFEVINDEKYAGSKFSRAWSFFDSEKATAVDRFQWMLNEMENMGLPEEMRKSEETTMEDLLKFFAGNDTVYTATVEHNAYRQGDKKEVKVHLMESVDSSSSVSPDAVVDDKGMVEGENVKFMGKEWKLLMKDGDDLKIQSLTNGNTRMITVADLD